jgi:hypothetical protein
MSFDDLGQRKGQPIMRDTRYLGRVLGFSATQIMMRLKAYPECCRNVRQPFEAESHTGSDCSRASQYAMKRLPRDAEIGRCLFH